MLIGYYGKQADIIVEILQNTDSIEISDVRSLVGELDFSFHAISIKESSKSSMNVSSGLSRASSFRDKND